MISEAQALQVRLKRKIDKCGFSCDAWLASVDDGDEHDGGNDDDAGDDDDDDDNVVHDDVAIIMTRTNNKN